MKTTSKHYTLEAVGETYFDLIEYEVITRSYLRGDGEADEEYISVAITHVYRLRFSQVGDCLLSLRVQEVGSYVDMQELAELAGTPLKRVKQ